MTERYIRISALCISLLWALKVPAQLSSVTYYHDATKMNQITVQETGIGALTPALYYDAVHHSYQRTAAMKNKLSFRTLASLSAYSQVEDADSVETCMMKRAEIEALNIADRQVDITWLAEEEKVTDKLTDFKANIDRIIEAGGKEQDQNRWNEYYHIFDYAIRTTQDAYMPNAQRKEQYLAIFADITKQNETLVAYLVQLNNHTKTAALLASSYSNSNHNATIATEAQDRWKNVARIVNTSK